MSRLTIANGISFSILAAKMMLVFCVCIFKLQPYFVIIINVCVYVYRIKSALTLPAAISKECRKLWAKCVCLYNSDLAWKWKRSQTFPPFVFCWCCASIWILFYRALIISKLFFSVVGLYVVRAFLRCDINSLNLELIRTKYVRR